MRLQFSGLVIALPYLLSACVSTSIHALPESPPTTLAGRCNAAPAQFVMGRVADAALENEARTRSGAKIARVLRPNQIVTMEFSAERLNLTVDQADRVTRVNCG